MDKQGLLNAHRGLMELRTKLFRNEIPGTGTVADTVFRAMTLAIQTVTRELRVLEIQEQNYDLFPAEEVQR